VTKKPEITLAKRALAAGITQFIDENRPAFDRLAAKFIDENRPFIERLAKVAERLNRNSSILEPALKAAGLHDKKIRHVIISILLEIEAGPTYAKPSHGGKRSGESRRIKAEAGWQALAGPRADEIKRKNPKFKANRIKTTMLREDPTGLPGDRTLADFIKHRFLTK
jgi:hypothetical protein